MQEFYINKNSLLPYLKCEIIKDGRNDYNKFYDLIQDSKVYFTMTNVENGIKKIVRAEATIMFNNDINCCVEDEYFLAYVWKQRDVNQSGIFNGKFEIEFNGNLSSVSGNLIVPIQEELIIYIQEESIKK